MTPLRFRSLLVVALVAGFVLAFVLPLAGVGSDLVIPMVGVVFAVCGVGGMVSAALLASGHVQPSRRWGISPLGNVLKSITWLGMAWLSFRPANAEHEPWYVGLLFVVPLVIGFRLDQQAWGRHHAT